MPSSPLGAGRRVLVLGDQDGHTAYTYGLELVAAGWEVHGGGPRPWMLAPARWCRSWQAIPSPEAGVGPFVAAVAAAVATVGADLVVACRDAELVALSAHRAEIGAPVALPPHATVLALLDKLDLVAHGARHGLPEPVTVPLEPGADRGAAGLRPPLVVKARLHLDEGRAGEATRRRPGWFAAARVDTWAAAEEHAAALAARGARPIAQELLGAPMSSIVLVLDRGGRVLVEGAMRATVLRKGSIAAGVTVEPDPALVGALVAMFRDLGAFGLLQVDVATRADGAGCPIDVNPRPFASMRAFGAAGFPVGALAAAVALGDPVAPWGTVPAGRRFGSFRGILGADARGEGVGPLQQLAEAGRAVRATRPVAIFPDPRPVARAAAARTVRGIRARQRPAGCGDEA